jgi:hypothetical protein
VLTDRPEETEPLLKQLCVLTCRLFKLAAGTDERGAVIRHIPL